MLFNSISFLVFFPVVAGLYFLIPRKLKAAFLLLASYFFYMCWNPKYIVLILITTVVTYAVGLFMGKDMSGTKKKALMGVGFFINFGLLFLFKYLDLSISIINKLLSPLHIGAISNPFDFLLPVGISFYTFQAIGYCIDIYRGDIKPEKNFIKYALFVSFFPQLVAGPIERSKNLLSQIDEMGKKKTLMCRDSIVSGFTMMMYGLFMKMVIADRVAVFVDKIYGNLYVVGTAEMLLAAFGFSIQIYADFAGYSAIAIGAARFMGIDLMENFNTPYFAVSIADFWRRWHISLSTWFRDYVYIPLGGNRKGTVRKYINLMITFLVSGLWHGASLSFVAWGGIHGIYQVVGDITKPLKERVCKALNVKKDVFSYKLGQVICTFLLTTFAWIFFRAGSIGIALTYIKRMFTRWNPWAFFDESLYTWGLDRVESLILLVAMLVLLTVSIVRYRTGDDIGKALLKQNLWFRWAVLLFFMITIVVYGEYGINFDSNKFIYFDF